MTRKEKLQLTRDGLKGYDRLERKSISDVDWIAFDEFEEHCTALADEAKEIELQMMRDEAAGALDGFDL